MAHALSAVTTRRTPQHLPASPAQVPNSAGGYTFRVPRDVRVHRFLTLGTDGGTYYASERALTAETAAVVLDAAREDGVRLVQQVVDVSTAGRAPRQQPGIFALAAVSALGDVDARRAAAAALPVVCRTGTALFQWAGFREQFGGWGRTARRSVASWYLDRTADDAAYQAVKYRQREGWTHRDLLRLAHPVTASDGHRALFQWVTKGGRVDGVPPIVDGFLAAQAATRPAEWVRVVEQTPGLTWEMLPDAALTQPAVWEALLAAGMPQTALLRQLPRLTRLGVLTSGSATTRAVTDQIADEDRLTRARVHPVNVLVAARTYAVGRSARGAGEWTPVPAVIDALDSAFYGAFRGVAPAGKRTLLALDVSGSMTAPAGGMPISCREASAALALVTAATERDVTIVGFTGRSIWVGSKSEISELPISPRQRLDDAVRAVSNLPFGATDCALPMVWAREQGRQFDTFVVYTDSETWHGDVHPHEALTEYRQATGIPARQVVVGMTATDFTIADPDDPGTLDVAGFDAAVPALISGFSRGDV